MAVPQGMQIEGGPPPPGKPLPRAPDGPSVTWTFGMFRRAIGWRGEQILPCGENSLLLKSQCVD